MSAERSHMHILGECVICMGVLVQWMAQKAGLRGHSAS